MATSVRSGRQKRSDDRVKQNFEFVKVADSQRRRADVTVVGDTISFKIRIRETSLLESKKVSSASASLKDQSHESEYTSGDIYGTIASFFSVHLDIYNSIRRMHVQLATFFFFFLITVHPVVKCRYNPLPASDSAAIGWAEGGQELVRDDVHNAAKRASRGKFCGEAL